MNALRHPRILLPGLLLACAPALLAWAGGRAFPLLGGAVLAILLGIAYLLLTVRAPSAGPFADPSAPAMAAIPFKEAVFCLCCICRRIAAGNLV